MAPQQHTQTVRHLLCSSSRRAPRGRTCCSRSAGPGPPRPMQGRRYGPGEARWPVTFSTAASSRWVVLVPLALHPASRAACLLPANAPTPLESAPVNPAQLLFPGGHRLQDLRAEARHWHPARHRRCPNHGRQHLSHLLGSARAHQPRQHPGVWGGEQGRAAVRRLASWARQQAPPPPLLLLLPLAAVTSVATAAPAAATAAPAVAAAAARPPKPCRHHMRVP